MDSRNHANGIDNCAAGCCTIFVANQYAGKVSHAQAMAKANEEYQKYQVKNISPVKEEYLLMIKDIEKQAKGHQ